MTDTERPVARVDSEVGRLRTVLLLTDMLRTALAEPAAHGAGVRAAVDRRRLGTDLADVVGSHLSSVDADTLVHALIAGMTFEETSLLDLVYDHHPRFADTELAYGSHHAPVEGGDVLLLAPGVLAIGVGERTTATTRWPSRRAPSSATSATSRRTRGWSRTASRCCRSPGRNSGRGGAVRVACPARFRAIFIPSQARLTKLSEPFPK